MAKALSEKALAAIESDPILFGKIADALKIKPISLPQLVKRNSRRLQEYPILKLIASSLGKRPEDLLETKVLSADEVRNTHKKTVP
jgi:hypothetical protein